MLFNDPHWDFRTLNFDSDVIRADREDRGNINAINPNLRPFRSAGGKLFIYHGWSDNLIAPRATVNYYLDVVGKMGGAEKTGSFARLFMVPGMAHCGGGAGTDQFDKVGVLEQWVEHGMAPDRIIAAPTMTLRKNTDPTLQATHTIDLKFSFSDGAPITGVKDVEPKMRNLGSTASEALTGVRVKISDVYFVIALAKGDQDAARNLDLMQTRAWFDFPLLLNDNRIAKLVFQKSTKGEAMLAKAFEAWK